MPSKEEQALDWILENAESQPDKSADAAMKIGVSDNDIKAWSFSKQNPDDPRSTQIRNKIFTKLSESQPLDRRRGAGFLNRFVLKNFADNDIKIQKKFLDDQGIITKIKVGDEEFDQIEDVQKRFPKANINQIGAELLRRMPDEGSFSRIEADVIDKFSFADWAIEAVQDFTDVSRELVEAGAVMIGTGAKALGSLGGPAGAAAGSAISGGITGGVEAARQGVGSALGVAEIDPSKVGRKFVEGAAVPAIFEGAKAGFKLGAKGVGLIPRLFGVAKKPGAKATEEAAEQLGAKATPGQLFGSPTVQKLEETLVKGGSTRIGGILSRLPKQVEANKKVVAEAADDLVSSRSFAEAFEAGTKAEAKLLAEVNKKLKPAEAIYNKYETLFKDIKPDTSKLKKLLGDLADEFKFDNEALSVVKAQAKKLSGVKNLSELKKFRTSTGKLLRGKEETRAAKMIYDAATEARNDTLLKAASEAGGEVAEQAAKDIAAADAIYRQGAKAVEKAFIPRGGISRLTPKRQAGEFFKKTKEIDSIKKILQTNDPKKIASVKKEFPETFEFLRQNQIENIAKQAEVKGEVNPARLVKILRKMPESSRQLLFGRDQEKKFQALKTYLDSIPGPFNTSNTANMLEFTAADLNPITQANSFTKYLFLEILANTQLGQTIINRAAESAASPIVKGAAVGARGLVIPEQNEGQ